MLKPGMVSSSAESLFQQALAMHSAGRFGKAEQLYRLSIKTDFDQRGAKHNLGSLLQGLGRLKEAGEIYLNILKLYPDQQETLYALGTVLLDSGDYTRGWPYYEARRNLPALKIPTPNLPFPEWQGEPLAGKSIVLFPEQGLGDNIQFARFALTLRDQGAKVILLTRPALTDLFRQSFDGIEVQSAEGTVALGALIGSLPLRVHLRHNPDSIPSAPYLRAATPSPPRPPGPWRIGLTTKGNPTQANDARRSLSPAQAARLQNLRDVQIISLHPEDTRAQDFARTAQIIAGLDLVISVDTAVAHLAGAMGKQAFVLVPGFNNDWRWLRGQNGEATLWYPTQRLFRGDPSGAWNQALDRLTDAVAVLTKGPPPPT
jgi:hypothetical protein